MLSLISIALAAAAGACCRFGLCALLGHSQKGLDLGILTANLSGSFILGFSLGLSFQMSLEGFQAVVVGFCGGLTTFSTFALNVVKAIDKRNWNLGVKEVVFNTVFSIVAVGLGSLLGKGF